MNERIRELERECWEPRKHPVSQAAMGDKFNTEKFAQSIIQECANFIDSHKQVDKYGEALDIVYGEDLLKHFGVKDKSTYTDIISDGGMDPRS